MMSAIDIGIYMKQQPNSLVQFKSHGQNCKKKLQLTCIIFIVSSYTVALYFVIRRARSGSAQYGDLFTLLQVVFGVMSTLILLLALRSISKIIH
jgi:hypothetical protein